jgi:hypothetical protein
MTRSRLAIQIRSAGRRALLAATAAHAATLTTPPLHPDAGGRLACTAVNAGGRSITIGVQILGDAQQNVTEFVATEWSSETDGILASVAAESSLPEARYCKVTIGGGRSLAGPRRARGIRTRTVSARRSSKRAELLGQAGARGACLLDHRQLVAAARAPSWDGSP